MLRSIRAFKSAQTRLSVCFLWPQLYYFTDQQTEVHWPDGGKEIAFAGRNFAFSTPHCSTPIHPDGTVKCLYPNGDEQTRFADGSAQFSDGMQAGVPMLSETRGTFVFEAGSLQE